MKRPRIIPEAEARAIYATYQRTHSLPLTARKHGRSVSACSNAMVRHGLHATKPRPIVTAKRLAVMRADYERGLSLAEVGRRHGVSGSAVRELFTRRGVPLRWTPVADKPRDEKGHLLRLPRLTDEEIAALIARATKMEVPAEIRVEWREWPLERRAAFVERLRAQVRPRIARPTTPFSDNVTPFGYGTPEAHAIAARLNEGCNSRTKKVSIRLQSQGVIWDGRLWFWSHKTGYLNGRWTPEAPRPELHRVIWEETHGRPVPASHVVRFADGNPNNFDPANLVLATRNDLARENQAAALFRKARQITGLLLSQTSNPTSDAHLISRITRRAA